MMKITIATPVWTYTSVESDERGEVKSILDWLTENIDKAVHFKFETETGTVFLSGDLLKESVIFLDGYRETEDE